MELVYRISAYNALTMLGSLELPATFIPLLPMNFFPLDFSLCYGYTTHMNNTDVGIFMSLFFNALLWLCFIVHIMTHRKEK